MNRRGRWMMVILIALACGFLVRSAPARAEEDCPRTPTVTEIPPTAGSIPPVGITPTATANPTETEVPPTATNTVPVPPEPSATSTATLVPPVTGTPVTPTLIPPVEITPTATDTPTVDIYYPPPEEGKSPPPEARLPETGENGRSEGTLTWVFVIGFALVIGFVVYKGFRKG